MNLDLANRHSMVVGCSQIDRFLALRLNLIGGFDSRCRFISSLKESFVFLTVLGIDFCFSGQVDFGLEIVVGLLGELSLHNGVHPSCEVECLSESSIFFRCKQIFYFLFTKHPEMPFQPIDNIVSQVFLLLARIAIVEFAYGLTQRSHNLMKSRYLSFSLFLSFVL